MTRRPPARIDHQLHGRTLRLRVSGEFGFASVPQLEAVVETVLPRIDRIEFDASGMSNIDSSGMGLLLLLQHRLGCGRTLAVIGCHGTARESIERLQLHRELQLVASAAA